MKEIVARLDRFAGDAETTLGRCFHIDQKKALSRFLAFILEDEYHKVKIAGDTRFPAGIYELELATTPHWSSIVGHPMIRLKNVPNYSDLLFHPGNTELDTRGCLVTGTCIGYDPIKDLHIIPGGCSRPAYKVLYGAIAPAIKSALSNGNKPCIEVREVQWLPYSETDYQSVIHPVL